MNENQITDENQTTEDIDYLAENVKLLAEIEKLKRNNSLLYKALNNRESNKPVQEEKEKEEEMKDYTQDVLNYFKRK